MHLTKRMVHLIHALLVAPLLVYVGYLGTQGEIVEDFLYQTLLALGLLAGAYHAYNLCQMMKLQETMMIVPNSQEERVIVDTV